MESGDKAGERKIIHIDMDAFYASVEQRDRPELRGKPVAVGGARGRGVVAAASYEARVFGVRSAMPSVTALRKCPSLIFVPPRFDVYRAVSRQIRAIFTDYTALIEPLSLDEAYLDVTEDRKGIGSATLIAAEIRARIQADTGLTASAGVSYNKFIAKLASDQNKPDGLCVIRPRQGAEFVATLPVRRFHGVGPVRARQMEALGIVTGADLREKDAAFLARHFGSFAGYLFRAARGIDERAVQPDRPHKSISVETTFEQDLTNINALGEALIPIADSLAQRVGAAHVAGRTVVLKLRFSDFRILTRSRTLLVPISAAHDLGNAGMELLRSAPSVARGVRLLGLGLSNLRPQDETELLDQPSLPFAN